jgi:protein-disulfide isomerase
MHDQLFSQQRLLSAAAFSELASRAGLDLEIFEACFKRHKTSGAVTKDLADGVSIGINSTPTFFVNGKIYVGGKSYEALREIVEPELRKLENTPDTTAR